MSVGVVILAAGESSRMGEPKQLLDFNGKTLLQHAIDKARAVHDTRVAVVLGANAALIRERIDERELLVVENADWRNGMASSVRAGLGALLAAQPDISAALFLPCDQPLLSAPMLGLLVTTQERTGCGIVAAAYDDVLGIPALFTRNLFPELLALIGHSGAREIIRSHAGETVGIPFPEAAADIDTPADYARLRHSLTATPV